MCCKAFSSRIISLTIIPLIVSSLSLQSRVTIFILSGLIHRTTTASLFYQQFPQSDKKNETISTFPPWHLMRFTQFYSIFARLYLVKHLRYRPLFNLLTFIVLVVIKAVRLFHSNVFGDVEKHLRKLFVANEWWAAIKMRKYIKMNTNKNFSWCSTKTVESKSLSFEKNRTKYYCWKLQQRA